MQRFRVIGHKVKNKTNDILVLMGVYSSKERQMMQKQTNTQECHKVVYAAENRTLLNRITLRKRGCQGGLFFLRWQSSVDPPRLRTEQKLSILRTERTRNEDLNSNPALHKGGHQLSFVCFLVNLIKVYGNPASDDGVVSSTRPTFPQITIRS